jgi:hypothetical protein
MLVLPVVTEMAVQKLAQRSIIKPVFVMLVKIM